MVINRRQFTALAATAAALAGLATRAAAAETLRLGTLQFGTVQWVLETIQRNHLDTVHNLDIQTTVLANTDAGRIALLAGGLDITALDWPFVATQRAAGNALSFAPFSDAVGGVVVSHDSTIASLADLAGKTLGIAGGPADKSWLLLRAAGAKQGIDLATACSLQYGAPPLLGAKLEQGALDAVLTYWNFVAKLTAAGYRELISIDDCAKTLGMAGAPGLVGFVFHEDWARANPAAIAGFLAAVDAAKAQLAQDDAAWEAIRPSMQAPDQKSFEALRARFRAGITHRPIAEQARDAATLIKILAPNGGPPTLPPGTFWQGADGAG